MASSKLCTGNRDLSISNRDLFFKIQGHYIKIVYVVLDKYKGTFGTQKFVHILVENINIMFILTIYYLAIGLIISFLLEHSVRFTGNDISFWERIGMIAWWPYFLIFFIISIINND